MKAMFQMLMLSLCIFILAACGKDEPPMPPGMLLVPTATPTVVPKPEPEPCKGTLWQLQTKDGSKVSMTVKGASYNYRQVEEGDMIYTLYGLRPQYYYRSDEKVVEEELKEIKAALQATTNITIMSDGVTVESTAAALSADAKAILPAPNCPLTGTIEAHHLAPLEGAAPVFSGNLADWDISVDLVGERDGYAYNAKSNTRICFTLIGFEQAFSPQSGETSILLGIKSLRACPAPKS